MTTDNYYAPFDWEKMLSQNPPREYNIKEYYKKCKRPFKYYEQLNNQIYQILIFNK